MSAEAPDRGREEGLKTPQAPEFTKDFISQLNILVDKTNILFSDERSREHTEKEVADLIYSTLNGTSNSFLLVKSEIAKVNFLDGKNSAFITEPDFAAFMASDKGKVFLADVVDQGVKALEREYTSGYQAEQQRFEKAQTRIQGFEDTPRPNADPTEKLIYQIAEKLGKDPFSITFDEAVKTGMMGVKPPSLAEIVKHGLSALEYANPKTDRKQYNEIQKRKRKVAAYQVADVLASDESNSLYRKKALEKISKMDGLNSARKLMDVHVKSVVNMILSTKDANLKIFTQDGVLTEGIASDLSFSAKQMPAIVVALDDKPIATITVSVRNGRIGYEYKADAYTEPDNFFDANVKKDRERLASFLKSALEALPLPDKKAPAKPEIKAPEAPKSAQEDADLKWIESLKESQEMELTPENIQRLVRALRTEKDYKPGKRGVMITKMRYGDKVGGLRIDRSEDPADFYHYLVGYIFPSEKQKGIHVTGPKDASHDNEVGTKIYYALIDSIEGREPKQEVSSEEVSLASRLAKIAKTMDEKQNYMMPTEVSEQIKFHGRDALLRIRREFVPKDTEGVDEKEKGNMVYTLSIMLAPETKVYSRKFITNRPLFVDWDDLGKKLYGTLEKAVNKKD